GVEPWCGLEVVGAVDGVDGPFAVVNGGVVACTQRHEASAAPTDHLGVTAVGQARWWRPGRRHRPWHRQRSGRRRRRREKNAPQFGAHSTESEYQCVQRWRWMTVLRRQNP